MTYPPRHGSAPDRSNGYDAIAPTFAAARAPGGVGARSVLEWSESLPPGATVLDLGCGSGIPIARALADSGFEVNGVDASPRMVRFFRENLPTSRVACEPVESSDFFGRSFDAIVAWGLIFLLKEQTQRELLPRIARALTTGGRLLFTAPQQRCDWVDLLTRQRSQSLGRDAYVSILAANGVSVVREFRDEGENHYYDALKDAPKP